MPSHPLHRVLAPPRRRYFLIPLVYFPQSRLCHILLSNCRNHGSSCAYACGLVHNFYGVCCSLFSKCHADVFQASIQQTFFLCLKKDIPPLSMPYDNLHTSLVHTLSIPQNFPICTGINAAILLVLKGYLYGLICSRKWCKHCAPRRNQYLINFC